jgi:hypothetical protein
MALKPFSTVICLVLGAYVIARAILVPITYDEAASYLRYISQDLFAVFSFEVATNHFLNTLLTRLASMIAGSSEFVLRVPSLMGFGLYLYFSIRILESISNRALAVAGLLLLNLNPYLLEYFALSRGYGLSLGLLMGALFFLLRFVTRASVSSAELEPTEMSRALGFACAAVMAGFTLLDAYAGILGVALVTIAVVARRRMPNAQTAEAASRWRMLPLHRSYLWLPLVATAFTALVLFQDTRLAQEFYEPVTLRVVGLTPAELDAVRVSRMDLHEKMADVPRESDASAWRLDPMPLRGLRVELPDDAARKLDRNNAFIETVIGSRPFVHQKTDDLWRTREAGGRVIFDSGPSLALPRSRSWLYQPVINWRGDRRHLSMVAAGTGEALSILGLLAVALETLGWVLQRVKLATADLWRPITLNLLWLAALAGPPLSQLKRSEELYFGGSRGFIEDTFYSLIENSFYGRTYAVDQTAWLFAIMIATILVFGLAAVVSYRRGRFGRVIPAACIFAIIAIASIAVVAEHEWLGTPYLLSRTALFYIPLFVLFGVFVDDIVAHFGRIFRTASVMVVIAAVGFAGYHLARTANVSYMSDWKRDADTKAMIADLAFVIATERPSGSRIVLGVDPTFSAAAAFYSQKVRTATIEMDTIPSPRAIDFFYVDARNAGGLSVIKRYPVAGAVLARPARPR